MTGEQKDGSAEAFDPYAFAERWFEENPEVLDKYIESGKAMDVARDGKEKK